MMKQRLDATFNRANVVGPELKLQADFARYLCVLVSGYIEKAVVAFVLEHARQRGGPTLQRFIELFSYSSLARSTRRKFPLKILTISSSEYPRSSRPPTNCW